MECRDSGKRKYSWLEFGYYTTGAIYIGSSTSTSGLAKSTDRVLTGGSSAQSAASTHLTLHLRMYLYSTVQYSIRQLDGKVLVQTCMYVQVASSMYDYQVARYLYSYRYLRVVPLTPH